MVSSKSANGDAIWESNGSVFETKEVEMSEEEWQKNLAMAGEFAILPTEIVHQVLSYLPLNSWGKGAQVCKTWNRICKQLLNEACFTTLNLNGRRTRMSRNFVVKEPREFRIVVIGSGASGKSCLVCRFIQRNYVEKYDPTIEDSYRKAIEIDGVQCILDIMDTGGAEYQALTDCYIKTAEGFMILYSINSKNSFEYTSKIRKRVLEIRGASKKMAPPILLVGTKADLIYDRAVCTEEGQGLANSWNTEYTHNFFETSSKTNQHGVNEAFYELVRQIDEWKSKQPSPKKDSKKAPMIRLKRYWTLHRR